MSKAWMPLYIGDYLADTPHLMATESGAYLHLLFHYWNHGPLPDDDSKLCRIAKVWPPNWKRVRKILEPYFDLTNTPGLWLHHRADLEISKAAKISNKRKLAALQKHSISSANAKQMHTQSQSQRKKASYLGEEGSQESNGVPSSAWTTADRIALTKQRERRQLEEREEHAKFMERRSS